MADDKGFFSGFGGGLGDGSTLLTRGWEDWNASRADGGDNHDATPGLHPAGAQDALDRRPGEDPYKHRQTMEYDFERDGPLDAPGAAVLMGGRPLRHDDQSVEEARGLDDLAGGAVRARRETEALQARFDADEHPQTALARYDLAAAGLREKLLRGVNPALRPMLAPVVDDETAKGREAVRRRAFDLERGQRRRRLAEDVSFLRARRDAMQDGDGRRRIDRMIRDRVALASPWLDAGESERYHRGEGPRVEDGRVVWDEDGGLETNGDQAIPLGAAAGEGVVEESSQAADSGGGGLVGSGAGVWESKAAEEKAAKKEKRTRELERARQQNQPGANAIALGRMETDQERIDSFMGELERAAEQAGEPLSPEKEESIRKKLKTRAAAD